MLKIILISLLLAHFSLQIEIVPEQGEESRGHNEAKKHFKNKEWKEHKKHKDEDGYKKPHYDTEWKKPHYDTEWKKAKHNNNKNQDYEKGILSYHMEKDHVRREIVEARPHREDIESHTQVGEINLSNDINVNKGGVVKDPDSEYLQQPKRTPTILNLSNLPDPNNTILMARYIIHHADWAAMATVTSRSGAKQCPFANIVSMSDGPIGEGSGVPYFYITPMDLSTQDISKINKASITVTLAQTDFCRKKDLDPQDPRCGRIILSGKVKRVKSGTADEEFATRALFSRHPIMKQWPKDHEFYLAKLKIGQIIVLDHFGGPTYIDVEQYLHPQSAI